MLKKSILQSKNISRTDGRRSKGREDVIARGVGFIDTKPPRKKVYPVKEDTLQQFKAKFMESVKVEGGCLSFYHSFSYLP